MEREREPKSSEESPPITNVVKERARKSVGASWMVQTEHVCIVSRIFTSRMFTDDIGSLVLV